MGKLLAFLLLVGFIGSSTEEQCLMKSPCSCLDENGSGIDLSSLESSSYLTAVLGNTSFFYHPCKDGKEIPTPPVNVSSDNVCNKDGFSVSNQFLT